MDIKLTIDGVDYSVTPSTPAAPAITSVKVLPSQQTVQSGATVQCKASVVGTGTFSTDVNWSADKGSVDAAGLFTAPATTGSAVVTATSKQDTTKTGTATLTVQAVAPATDEPVIPADAQVFDMLKATGWQMNHDAGTSGDSVGTTSYPVTGPEGTPNCRLFDFTNKNGGGEIYHLPITRDASKHNKVCVEIEHFSPNPKTVTNHEIDVERVNAQGVPLDMASQEDGYSGVFDITANHHWTGTGIKVDPANHVPNKHYTKKIYFFDNGDGTVTYPGVKLDNVWYKIGVTAKDQDASKWSPNDLNLQVQFDTKASIGNVESKVYFVKLNVYLFS